MRKERDTTREEWYDAITYSNCWVPWRNCSLQPNRITSVTATRVQFENVTQHMHSLSRLNNPFWSVFLRKLCLVNSEYFECIERRVGHKKQLTCLQATIVCSVCRSSASMSQGRALALGLWLSVPARQRRQSMTGLLQSLCKPFI